MGGFRRVALHALIAFLAFVAGSTAFARTIYVPSGKPTIQGAINAAANGDVIVVAQGTYNENINFKGKAITVRSTNPTNKAVVAATIIDGQQNGSVAVFRSGEEASSVLRGFTLTNGSGRLNEYNSALGGGVHCDTSSPTIANNVIVGNSADAGAFTGEGGGIYCYSAAPTITGNTISDNSADNGGGLCCRWYSSPTLTNNIISGNSAESGGGMYCEFASSPTVVNCTLSGNSAWGRGGGIYCNYDCSPILKNSIVAFTVALGGLHVHVDAHHPCLPTVTFCDFYANTGGNYVNWPDPTGTNGNISKNPRFANPAAGDFHEKSKGGRWNPNTKTWVKDTVQSPCINAGDRTSAFAKEPAPNGGRINMGAYGNTSQASKTAPKSAVEGAVFLTATATSCGANLSQITVNLTSAASVQVSVLNLAGRVVAVLPERDVPQGLSTLLWDGKSMTGTVAPAGRYFVRVTARGDGGEQCEALAGLSLTR